MGTGLHEEFAREERIAPASNKRFGLVVGAILLAIGGVRAWLHGEFGPFSGSLAGIGLVLMLAAVTFPAALAPANRGWMRLGLVLHKVTNPLFLGAMYAIAIVPTGLLMRVFGADPMGLRRAGKGTYWISRAKTSSTAQSLEKPF